ncbi:NAD-dependent epimerase/dehydratase family protein [Candidatus Gracilibacteria bacterium]|nr:NAD-dependent epimerase/dehydratase family protein [Candidatus Gracilibacteria bacterium]
MTKILITGTSGFIGFHLAKKLLDRGDEVVGVDCENDYYDQTIKYARRDILEKYSNFKFYKIKLENFDDLKEVFENESPEKVCNLAAQAGVRYSLINPFAYVQSNIVGFHNLIELSKVHGVKNFVYASSSSVYGKNEKQPFSVDDKVDSPISIYAASKRSNELIAHTYSHLYGLPTTGLRFFTVYGPWGRPDMAMLIFANKMVKNEPIPVFNYGKMRRDFTYIDDIVEGVTRCIDNNFKYEILNIGNNNTVELEYVIDLLEKNLGIKAIKDYMPIQPGDVPATWADIEHTKDLLNWQPTTSIETGLENFINWYKEYYKI